MLFLNVNIWELNWHKWVGSQFVAIFKWEMYGGTILFTYLPYPQEILFI